MSTRKNSSLTSQQLDRQIDELIRRRKLAEERASELESQIHWFNKQLKSLYAKRTIALNFTLPLEDAAK